ncbi:MAG: hypothetical protein AAF541_10955 [Pseudomonadota bacterium]
MSFSARIEDLELDPDSGVVRLGLSVDPEFAFKAGQYLCVHTPDEATIPLSIASAPHQQPQLNLHYKSTPGDPAAQSMDRLLDPLLDPSLALGQPDQRKVLEHSAALGDCICPEYNEPFLILAAGTGVTQAWSCAEHRKATDCGETHILWCAEHQQDLYCLQDLEALEGTRVIAKVDPSRTADNLPAQWIKSADLALYKNILLAGGPDFVYAMTDLLCELGISQSCLMADAYSYAPRS